jgi:hypothetical protein
MEVVASGLNNSRGIAIGPGVQCKWLKPEKAGRIKTAV